MSWSAMTPLILPGIVLLLLLLFGGAALCIYLLSRIQRAEFWEREIRAFEAADRLHPPEAGAILFTGSSSIRLWHTLERDMAPLRVLGRGFGGCHLAHVNHYLERIVLPYRPRAIVLYAGENDLSWPSRKTPQTVLADFQQLVATVQAKLPAARIYFVAIKRSLLRRRHWKAMDEMNRLVQELAAGCEGVTFIDTSKPMLDAAGNPRGEYLPWHRLHLTAEGYALWGSIIRPILEADLKSAQPAKAA